jgi:TonB family protein
MTWWHYLLLVNLYLLLFYGFYALLLRNETFFQLNRAYLVAGALLSFIIPVIQANWIKQLFITQRVQQTIYSTIYHPEFVYQAKPAGGLTFTIGEAFAVIYIGGTIFLLGRFFFQLLSVKKLLRNLESAAAFSFFNKIKIDAGLPEQQTIIDHEEVHVKQWHSADVLFIEAVMIINWFNPIVYFYRKAIKHVHEFIADKKAIERGTSKTEYAYLLLSQTFGANPHQLTNNFFNKSLLKQRIIMLNKDESKRRKLLKYGLSAPLFAAMLILSSATVKNSSVLRIINKKTEQIFLMNTMPGKQIKDITIIPEETVSAPEVIAKKKEIKIDLTDSAAATEPANAKFEKFDSMVFSAVEVQPEFPGGEIALAKFLQANLKYPKLAYENGIQGKVYIQFVVQKDGNLGDMKVLREPGSGLGEEAVRVLSESPKWIPGVQNGHPVKVQFTIPVNFRLATDNTVTTDTLHRAAMGMLKSARVNDYSYRYDTRGMDTANMSSKQAAKVIFFKRSSTDMSNAAFTVNGKELTPEQATSIKPDRIEKVQVIGGAKDQSNNDKLKKVIIAIMLKDTKADH